MSGVKERGSRIRCCGRRFNEDIGKDTATSLLGKECEKKFSQKPPAELINKRARTQKIVMEERSDSEQRKGGEGSDQPAACDCPRPKIPAK